MAIATTPNDNALLEDKKDLDSPTRDSQQTPERPSDNQKPLSSLRPSPVGQGLSVDSFKFNNLKKTIGCICSGAQLLISAKIVKGRKVSGYYSMMDDIENAGALYTDLPAVIDENLVTTAHYKDLGPWMKAVLEVNEKQKTN